MPAKKKILLNALHLSGNFSGVHRYTENLIQHLITVNLQIDPIKPGKFANSGNCDPGKKQSFHRLRRVWYEQTQMNRDFRLGKYDLYHATNYILPFYWQAPSILTVHDTISLDYPDLCKNETAIYYGLLLKRSIRNARKVLVVSKKVKQDVIRHTGVEEEKVKVTYLGIDPNIFLPTKVEKSDGIRKQYNLPEKYCLFVGNLEPKKNLSRLIEAFHQVLPNLDENYSLVIVGQPGWKYQSIFETIERLKIQSHVMLLGYVAQKDLSALYQQASVFVFPSLYEGFGLPVIEAMACGTPVLVSNRGSLPEITGGYARQVDPLDIHSISKGLFDLLKTPDQKNIHAAQHWVKQFNWGKTASETLTTYEEVLNSPAA